MREEEKAQARLQWLDEARAVLRIFSKDKVQDSEKFVLLKRGLKRGSVYFPGTRFPFVKLPDWYVKSLAKGDLTEVDKRRMQEIVEERKACFYVLNELIDVEKKLLTEHSYLE